MQNSTNLITQKINKVNHLTGIPSGLTELDKITSGWQKSELIVIGGRPAMGKTAFALSIARNATIDFRKSVAIFNTALSANELAKRLITIESGIASGTLKKEIKEGENNSKEIKLAQSSLFIEYTPHILVSEIRNKILKLLEKQSIALIVIENLQEIKDDSQTKRSRTQEILSITGALKALAKEFNVPVVVFSDVKRSAEENKNHHPSISDLPHYKGITSNASIMMFISRPSYYDINVDENGNSTREVAELMILQQDHKFCSDTVIKIKYETLLSHFSNY